jgi:hypothetical protein
MSAPHTGKLVANIRGLRCEFDGNSWRTPDAELTRELNSETDRTPKTHYSIHQLARIILHDAGLDDVSEILSVEFDGWKTDIPDDAID